MPQDATGGNRSKTNLRQEGTQEDTRGKAGGGKRRQEEAKEEVATVCHKMHEEEMG